MRKEKAPIWRIVHLWSQIYSWKIAIPPTLFVWKTTTMMAESQIWNNKKTVKTTAVVCTWSTNPCLVLSRSDRLPWKGPWGGQPWRFSGLPPRHHSGHWGVQADQPGTPNQINHLSHEALGQSRCFPTGSLQLSSPRKMFPIFISHTNWKTDWNQSAEAMLHQQTSAVCHCQISFHNS